MNTITMMTPEGIINILKSYKKMKVCNLRNEEPITKPHTYYKEIVARHYVSDLTISKKDNDIIIKYNDKYNGSLVLSENTKYIVGFNKVAKDCKIQIKNVITGNYDTLVIFHNGVKD